MEQWADIRGFEGYYQVSTIGRVRNARTLYALKPRSGKAGYPLVNLWKDGERFTHRVHRLVAVAFLENIYNKPAVNHKDSNRKNNNVSNLEWCTDLENVRHAIENGSMNQNGGKNRMAKQVLHLQTGVFFDCLKDGSKCFGFNYNSIKYQISGKSKTISPFIYI